MNFDSIITHYFKQKEKNPDLRYTEYFKVATESKIELPIYSDDEMDKLTVKYSEDEFQKIYAEIMHIHLEYEKSIVLQKLKKIG